MPAPNRRTKIINARGARSALEANKSLFEDGELCFATDELKYYVKYGTALIAIGGGEGSSVESGPLALSDYVVQENYTIPVGKNAASFGDTVVADGYVVEIPAGSTWTIYD